MMLVVVPICRYGPRSNEAGAPNDGVAADTANEAISSQQESLLPSPRKVFRRDDDRELLFDQGSW
jgi:hypothetical protein